MSESTGSVKARCDLERAFREMKPGDRYDIRNPEGRVVAVLGMPSLQPVENQIVETPVVYKKST